MISDLTTNPKIKEACKEFKVKELHAFGSVLSQDIEESLDIDLLVVFNRDGYDGAFEQFMGFKERLESIFRKKLIFSLTKSLEIRSSKKR